MSKKNQRGKSETRENIVKVNKKTNEKGKCVVNLNKIAWNPRVNDEATVWKHALICIHLWKV